MALRAREAREAKEVQHSNSVVGRDGEYNEGEGGGGQAREQAREGGASEVSKRDELSREEVLWGVEGETDGLGHLCRCSGRKRRRRGQRLSRERRRFGEQRLTQIRIRVILATATRNRRTTGRISNVEGLFHVCSEIRASLAFLPIPLSPQPRIRNSPTSTPPFHSFTNLLHIPPSGLRYTSLSVAARTRKGTPNVSAMSGSFCLNHSRRTP